MLVPGNFGFMMKTRLWTLCLHIVAQEIPSAKLKLPPATQKLIYEWAASYSNNSFDNILIFDDLQMFKAYVYFLKIFHRKISVVVDIKKSKC